MNANSNLSKIEAVTLKLGTAEVNFAISRNRNIDIKTEKNTAGSKVNGKKLKLKNSGNHSKSNKLGQIYENCLKQNGLRGQATDKISLGQNKYKQSKFT